MDADAFARRFAWKLRWWLLGVPAGIGLATLRASLKLWLGFSWRRSGVFSAGNGPAMRSAILGATIEVLDSLKRFVRNATIITHTDPKAYQGALAVAVAAWCAKRGLDQSGEFFKRLDLTMAEDSSDEFRELMAGLEQSIASHEETQAYVNKLGGAHGVSGYVLRTVPAALHVWLSQPRDFASAVSNVIRLGGDTDTTAAIVGAIVGSRVGRAGIPHEWRRKLWEWPRSVAWMERLADALQSSVEDGPPRRAPSSLPGAGLPRNVLFITAVVGHVVRRLFPPY